MQSSMGKVLFGFKRPRIFGLLMIAMIASGPSYGFAQVLAVTADGASCTHTRRSNLSYVSLRQQLHEFLPAKVAYPDFILSKGKGKDANKLAYRFRGGDNSICLVDIKATRPFDIAVPTKAQKDKVLELMAENIEAMIVQCEKNAFPRWKHLTKKSTIIYDGNIFFDTNSFIGCRKTVLSGLAAVRISTKSKSAILVLFYGDVLLIRL